MTLAMVTMTMTVGGGGSSVRAGGGRGSSCSISIGHIDASSTFAINIAAAELGVFHFNGVHGVGRIAFDQS